MGIGGFVGIGGLYNKMAGEVKQGRVSPIRSLGDDN